MERKPSLHTMIEEFAVIRRRQWTATLLVVPLVVAAFLFTERDEEGRRGRIPTGFAIGAAALVVGVLAFSLWNWRCPACRRSLGRGMSPRFCRHCEQQLRE